MLRQRLMRRSQGRRSPVNRVNALMNRAVRHHQGRQNFGAGEAPDRLIQLLDPPHRCGRQTVGCDRRRCRAARFADRVDHWQRRVADSTDIHVGSGRLGCVSGVGGDRRSMASTNANRGPVAAIQQTACCAARCDTRCLPRGFGTLPNDHRREAPLLSSRRMMWDGNGSQGPCAQWQSLY